MCPSRFRWFDCRLFFTLLLLLFSTAWGRAHPIKGWEQANFRVFRNYTACSLHGPMADFLPPNVLPPSAMTGEKITEETKEKIAVWLKDWFVVQPDGKECPVVVEAVYFYPSSQQIDNAFELTLRYPTETPAKSLTVTAKFDPKTVVSVGGASRELTKSDVNAVIPTNAGLDSLWRNVLDFTVMGMEHLLTGYDHILFICTLLFAAMNLRGVIKLLTAFTVGHALTLLLTTFAVIRVPTRLIDIAIAGTIIYVALENILRKQQVRHRWLLVFGFGLIHGMSFSESLREMGLPQNGLVLCLLSFNLGIEIAQVIIVAIVLPLLLRLRWMRERLRGERGAREFQHLLHYGSAGTALVGCYWIVRLVFRLD